jgi:hypothetical protein
MQILAYVGGALLLLVIYTVWGMRPFTRCLPCSVTMMLSCCVRVM